LNRRRAPSPPREPHREPAHRLPRIAVAPTQRAST
jgi:hypothetical protein